jgi:predicted porin
MSRKGELDVDIMVIKNECSAMFAMVMVLVAAAQEGTASIYNEVRAWVSIQGSTKPFLSSQAADFAWDQM